METDAWKLLVVSVTKRAAEFFKSLSHFIARHPFPVLSVQFV